MRRLAAFAVGCLTTIGATLGLLLLLYHQPADRRAIIVGAVVSFAIQLVAFSVALAMAPTNVMAGWGAGAVLRLLALALYALLAVPQLGLPLTAALVSLALYLFLSTLIEPFFLKS
jgi:hypothetical protein